LDGREQRDRSIYGQLAHQADFSFPAACLEADLLGDHELSE
jgi:hypothetical protein